MGLFNKKFKIRVTHYTSNYFVVEYTYYRFIPIYKALHFWFEQTLTSGTECWSTNLFRLEEAEEVAKSLNSIEDVKAWYKADEEKERLFYTNKAEYYKKSVPYKTKQF